MSAPVNSVLPVITGTAEVGESLAVDDGTWTGTPTGYTYAWLRAGVVIDGEVSNAYVVALADIGKAITARVTATNADGSTPATSAATSVVPSTLVPETGAVVAGADSYGSLAQADAYHSARGNTAWAALTAAQKEAAARKATDYMVQMYRARWKGYRKDGAQALDWPRSFVYLEPFVHGVVGTYPYLVADDSVPTEVVRAWAELALRAGSEDLAPDLERQAMQETIGPISVTYDRASSYVKKFRAVDALLAPYLTGSPNSAKVVRS